MSIARSSNLLGNIAMIIIVGCCCSSAQGKYGGGSGTPEDPYQILDVNHMQAIGADANDWDKCFKLTADIDLSGYIGTEFNPIGRYIGLDHPDNLPFTGVLDGNDHMISNLNLNMTERHSAGLFGYVGEGGKVANLRIENVCISGYMGTAVGGLAGTNQGTVSNSSVGGRVIGGADCSAGGLVGHNYMGGTITNCSSIGEVFCPPTYPSGSIVGGLVGRNEGRISGSCSAGSVLGEYVIGGLVGFNFHGLITNCRSVVSVEGSENIGGLVGSNHGSITKCSSAGNVWGRSVVGGLVGHNYYSGITNCYSATSVTGEAAVGGLVGANGIPPRPGCYQTTIANCYAIGTVTGDEYVGGLVGWNLDSCTVIGMGNSFWNTQTTGLDEMCGNESEFCDNSHGKTTAQMKQQSTFTNWDFINTWNIGENQTYPYLRIYLAGDINKDGIVNSLDIAITANQWMEQE